MQEGQTIKSAAEGDCAGAGVGRGGGEAGQGDGRGGGASQNRRETREPGYGDCRSPK